MEQITESEFVRDLDAYIARVEQGESFEITRNGRAFAVVKPHPMSDHGKHVVPGSGPPAKSE